MAVVYENQEDGMVKAYSDQHKKIFGGSPESTYDVVYDPIEAHRTYVETDEYIDSMPKRACRVFSRLYLEIAVAKLGLIEQFDSLLKSIEIEPGYTAYRAFERANEISEDFPHFNEYMQAIQTSLGLTSQQVEQVLQQSVMET